MITFRSPSHRLTLTVDGRLPLGETDFEWLQFLGSRPDLIEAKLAETRSNKERRHIERQRELQDRGRVRLFRLRAYI